MKFAQVIVDISAEAVDKPFQYIIPEHLEDEITVGNCVDISFGNTHRKGYVVGITDEPEIEMERLKELTGVSEKSLSVDSKFIKLAYWMKNKYGTTMNQALRTVLPVKRSVKHGISRTVKLLISHKESETILEELPGEGRKVAVVGAGNTAFEEAIYLSNICKKVYLIHRNETFKASPSLVKKLKNKDNVEFILNSNVLVSMVMKK